jgi:hypothetical protein
MWPRGLASNGGRPTTAFHAILCDNVNGKLIDFIDFSGDARTLELISKLSRAGRRASCAIHEMQ